MHYRPSKESPCHTQLGSSTGSSVLRYITVTVITFPAKPPLPSSPNAHCTKRATPLRPLKAWHCTAFFHGKRRARSLPHLPPFRERDSPSSVQKSCAVLLRGFRSCAVEQRHTQEDGTFAGFASQHAGATAPALAGKVSTDQRAVNGPFWQRDTFFCKGDTGSVYRDGRAHCPRDTRQCR